MAQEEYKLLDQRHLDQNVARADADKIQQESAHAFSAGRRSPSNKRRKASTTMMARILIPTTSNNNGSARLIL